MAETKVAVIGAGYWGKNLVRNFHQLGALAAVVETEAERRQGLAREYEQVLFTGDLSAILEDASIGAVAIAAPAETHGNLAARCLYVGKHVFVEKPICLDVQQGMELVRMAKERQLTLMVGHLLHYHPAIIKLKELLNSGRLGRLEYIYSNRLNLGKFRNEENILWSFAPHDVSVILSLAGEMPNQVTCAGGSYLQAGIVDVTISTLAFPSGVRSHIHVSWLHPFKEQRLVVVGSEGMAVFDDTEPERKLVFYPKPVVFQGGLVPTPSKEDPVVVELDPLEPLKNECAHFLECVRLGLTPLTDGREGLRVLRVLDQCQQSLDMDAASLSVPKEPPAYFAHPTAIIDEGAEIGQGSKIWHFSHVLPGSIIGQHCNIGQNVVIGPKAIIGNGCKIQNNVSVFQGVVLRDNVFCGPSMVFTNVINPRANINRKDEYRNTLVEEGATLGANCTIVCGHLIGRYAFIGAGAVVTKNVPAYALMVGNPAKQIGWMCACATRLVLENDKAECLACGLKYVLADGALAEA